MGTDDHELARRLAATAGEELVALRSRPGWSDAGTLGEAGDRNSHERLVAGLLEQRPDDAVLSEHGTAGAARAPGVRTWIVDPLDGTREFGEPDRSDWAVHVALARDDALLAGAVALPARGEVLSTAEPPRRPEAGRELRVVVSRSRPPAFATRLAESLGAETVPLGSAGAKIAAVVLGEADIYVHAGGQYEWDSAAPVAVARAAGLHTSRLDGSELTYNRADPWLPDLVVCRQEQAAPVLSELARADPGGPAR